MRVLKPSATHTLPTLRLKGTPGAGGVGLHWFLFRILTSARVDWPYCQNDFASAETQGVSIVQLDAWFAFIPSEKDALIYIYIYMHAIHTNRLK